MQGVLDALGGSIAAGELKGDYAAAEAAAAAALTAVPADADANSRAEAALWASIVAALRFDLSTAASRLAEATRAAPHHPLRRPVADLVMTAGRRMPDGTLSPPLLGSDEVVWPPAPKGGLLEAEVFTQAWLPLRAAFLQSQRDSPKRAMRREALELGLRDLGRIWDERPHARLAAAELCRGARAWTEAGRQLDAAIAGYSTAGDVAGLASCDLARGAWAAVKTAGPLTLGLELRDESLSGAASHANVSDGMLAAAQTVKAGARFYKRAGEGFRAVGARRGVAMVDLHRAAVAALHDDPAAALTAAERAREAFEGAGDPGGAHLAAAHGALARIQAREWPERTDIAEAIGAWGRGSGSPGWALGIGLLFSHAGWRWLRRDGDADRAVAGLRLAETTFTALGADDFAQQTLSDRAAAHAWAADLDAALAAADRALRMFAGLIAENPAESDILMQREESAASVVRWLAYQARDAGRVEATRPALERQLARHEDAAGWVGAPPEIAELAAEMRRALDWDRAFAPAFRAVAARRRQPRVARLQLQRALAAAAAVGEDQRGRLEALVLLECGDRSAARAAFAAHPPPDPDPPKLDELIADADLAVSLEHWKEARRRHQALDGLRPRWWEETAAPWSQVGQLARTAEGLGEKAPARQLYASALALLEESRSRLAPRDDRGRRGDPDASAALYGDAARAALVAGDDPGAALQLAEHARARSLLSRMAASAALAGSAPGQRKELRKWRELTARVEVLTSLAAQGVDAAAELAGAEEELRGAEVTLAAGNRRWLDAVTPPAGVLGAREIAGALPKGAVLIEHLLVAGALLAWAVTPDGRVQAESPSLDDAAIDELQRNLWQACQGESDLWEDFARDLAEPLLAPFDAAIKAADHVVFVPHRWGRLAPLHALPWRGKPLVARKSVSVLPAASALRFLPASAPLRGGRFLAAGDPTNMSRRRPGQAQATGGFAALPWSGAQAAEAAAWFGGTPALLGAAAREESVRRRIRGARIVHFATHGELDAAPLLSCIVLADGDTLDVWELLGLPLDADLVTFSACDTAGTPSAAGDELVGLGWLTLAAGARAVVASLWEVPELSTALLMRAFYRALHGKQTPRAALASAQRHVRGLTPATAAPEVAALRAAAVAAGRADPGEPANPPLADFDFSHPYHWAGFVLIGV